MMLLSWDLTVWWTRFCKIEALSHVRLRRHIVVTAHLQRRAQPTDGTVQELSHPFFLFAATLCSHRADHPLAFFRAHPEEALEELALSRDGLVHPSEHVADIAQRVVRVQLYRSREAARAAACQSRGERAQQRRLARLREQGQGFAAMEGGSFTEDTSIYSG